MNYSLPTTKEQAQEEQQLAEINQRLAYENSYQCIAEGEAIAEIEAGLLAEVA